MTPIHRSYLVLTIVLILLTTGSMLFSVFHDHEDNTRFCQVVDGIVQTTKPSIGEDPGIRESYLRWVSLSIDLGCTSGQTPR